MNLSKRILLKISGESLMGDSNYGLNVSKEKLKKYLTEEELLLCDTDRERLLIQRELVELGMLSEMDLISNNFDLHSGIWYYFNYYILNVQFKTIILTSLTLRFID